MAAKQLPSALPSPLSALLFTANEPRGALAIGSQATSIAPFHQAMSPDRDLDLTRSGSSGSGRKATAHDQSRGPDTSSAASSGASWGGVSTSSAYTWTRQQVQLGSAASPLFGVSGSFSFWSQNPFVMANRRADDPDNAPLLVQLLSAMPKLSSSEDTEQVRIHSWGPNLFMFTTMKKESAP